MQGNGGVGRTTKPAPRPWPFVVGCGSVVFMLCLTAVVVAWIAWGI